MNEPHGSVQVEVSPDVDELTRRVAARLASTIAEAQAGGRYASIVLTGGRVGTAVLAALGQGDARDSIEWSRLHLWWGDERFLPDDDPERNVTQAREALLGHVPLEPANVHPMPASDGPDGDDAEGAARRYAEELSRATASGDHADLAFLELPQIDVLLLGVGPDGHVASLFPGLPGTHDQRAVVAVYDAPKPPPTRLSLTLSVIRSAREVWLVVAGADKAEAVGRALRGADEHDVPAAGARGQDRTLWLLDEAAAAQVPRPGGAGAS